MEGVAAGAGAGGVGVVDGEPLLLDAVDEVDDGALQVRGAHPVDADLEAVVVAEQVAIGTLGVLIVLNQVVLRFEKAMYEDPKQDLNKLWWDLVEKYQLIKRPEGRNAPDYASKIHIVSAPAYYHNYMMGQLFASQVHHAIAREVLEETGVRVRGCRYLGSQPWPFPGQLMLGFIASAEPDEPRVDDELEDARWFDADEIRAARARDGDEDDDGVRLSAPLSISRWLVDQWLSTIEHGASDRDKPGGGAR